MESASAAAKGLSADDAFTAGLAFAMSSAIDSVVVGPESCGFVSSRSYAANRDAAAFLAAREQTLEVRNPPLSNQLIREGIERLDPSHT